ncbi:hypothetical protein FF1_000934 [Malus domestica]
MTSPPPLSPTLARVAASTSPGSASGLWQNRSTWCLTRAMTSTGSSAALAPIATSNLTQFATRPDLPPTTSSRARLTKSCWHADTITRD